LQTFTNESIGILEEPTELGILLGMTVHLVKGVEKVVGAGRIREAFDQSLDCCQWLLIVIKNSYNKPED
jgi:hypothetical protein